MNWKNPSPADTATFPPKDVFQAGLRNHHIANTAYPINHNVTMKDYRVPRADFERTAAAAWAGIGEMGLYVHIPFCQQRCNFCEYTVINPATNAEWEDRYFDLLLVELALYQKLLTTRKRTLVGFDVGGGTPAFARAENIARLLDAVRDSFRFAPNMAMSIETTPRIAADQPEKIAAFRQMGFERISMGVQVTQLSLAKKLGRQYRGFSGLLRAVENIRAVGFERFNIDLMYGFAGQSVADWRDSVEKALELGAEYITLYRMRYKGTMLAAHAAQVEKETVTRMYAVAHKLLNRAGYVAVPGKNTFSRIPGDDGCSDYLSRRVVHGTPYLGLGLGAQSLTHHTLAYNRGAASKTIEPYERAIAAGRIPVQDMYDMPRVVSAAKFVSVAFYFGGINRRAFAEKFGVSPEEFYPRAIPFVLENGLMAYRGDNLNLTPKGVENYNGVIALFYAPAVQAYLLGDAVKIN